MGNNNKRNEKRSDKAIEEFVSFLQNHKKKITGTQIQKTEKMTFNSELKWKKRLIDILQQTEYKHIQINQQIKQIVKAIPRENFIKAVNILSALDNVELAQLNSKNIIKQNSTKMDVRLSKNVFLNMEKKFLIKKFKSESQIIGIQNIKVSNQEKDKIITYNRQKIKKIVKQEFNQSYHPFKSIKESFMMIVRMKYREILNQSIITDQLKQKIITNLTKDIDFFCDFIAKGSNIYKKWIINFGNLQQSRYLRFMKKNMLSFLFDESNKMYQIVYDIVKQLNQRYCKIIINRIRDNISISKFLVKQELQIQGCYVKSMMLFSQLNILKDPKLILETLESIKNEICNDIDYYHKMFETGKNETIDGDNLLGILCYQICKLKFKFEQIYNQIMVLNVIYGDKVNLDFGVASYMVTAIMAGFQYIESNQFVINSKQ